MAPSKRALPRKRTFPFTSASPSRALVLSKVTMKSESSSSIVKSSSVKVKPEAEPANLMVSSHSAIRSEAPVTGRVTEAEPEPALMVRSTEEAAVKSEAAAVLPVEPIVTRTATFSLREVEAASRVAVTLAVTCVPFSERVRGLSEASVTARVTPRSLSARVIRAGVTENPARVPTTPTVRLSSAAVFSAQELRLKEAVAEVEPAGITMLKAPGAAV